MIQREIEFSGAGGELNGLPPQNEEVYLLHLQGIFTRGEIRNSKISGIVGLCRNFRLSQTFKFYLTPCNGQSVFIQHPAAQSKRSVGAANTPRQQERHRCSRNSQTMEHEETLLSAAVLPPLFRLRLRAA